MKVAECSNKCLRVVYRFLSYLFRSTLWSFPDILSVILNFGLCESSKYKANSNFKIVGGKQVSML
jgi:hypothetical protein